MTAKVWTRAEVEALGVRTTVEVAGSILGGLSRTQAYLAVRNGRFPVPVIPVGRRLMVPVQPILELLGVEARTATAGERAAESARIRQATHGDPRTDEQLLADLDAKSA